MRARYLLAAFVSLLALALWLGGERPSTRHRASPRASEPRASAWPSLTWASPASAAARVYESADGGVSDGSIIEAPPLPVTGRVADEVIATICPPAVRTICDARHALGCGQFPFDEEVYADDERRPTCEELLFASCETWAREHFGWQPDVLVLDDAAVHRCLDAVTRDARRGIDTGAVELACGELAAVPVHAGEACAMTSSWGCLDGACIEGRCVPTGDDGQQCLRGACAPGLACIDGHCSPATSHGASCDEETPCADLDDRCLRGRCVTPIAGDTCTRDDECAVGARCAMGQCALGADTCIDAECGRGRTCEGLWTAVCERFVRGEPCTQTSDCVPGLDCVDGMCATLPWAPAGLAGEGATCNQYGITEIRCREGLACARRAVDGVCRADLCLDEMPYFRPLEDCH